MCDMLDTHDTTDTYHMFYGFDIRDPFDSIRAASCPVGLRPSIE
jgi:hypothetical protein